MRIKGIRLWMNQSCCSLGLSLKILSRCSLHFVGIKVFIVGYVRECEKSFFRKIWGFGESLATGTSHEFQSPNNKMARLYFLSYSDSAILILQLSACFTHVIGFW